MWPGSDATRGLTFLFALFLAPSGFSPVTTVFPLRIFPRYTGFHPWDFLWVTPFSPFLKKPRLPNSTKVGRALTKILGCRVHAITSRELKIETFSGRRRPDWQSKPGTEAAVASLQNSNIKIAVNSGGRRLGRLPKRKIWLHIKN